MQYYDPYRRSPRRQPTRTLTLDQIKQIEATLQELEQEAVKWKELAGKWEAAAKEERQRVSQLEERLQEQLGEDPQENKKSTETAVDAKEASEKAEEKITRMEQHLARAQAEYENAKKRLETRYANILDQNIMEFLRDLLPVLDNLDRAIQHAPADASGEGVQLTHQMFLSTLSKYGVKPIDALGAPFNPVYHEAIGNVVDPKLAPDTVAVVDQQGYTYRDKLLRPARVLITPAG